jgi:hypothetical protein
MLKHERRPRSFDVISNAHLAGIHVGHDFLLWQPAIIAVQVGVKDETYSD